MLGYSYSILFPDTIDQHILSVRSLWLSCRQLHVRIGTCFACFQDVVETESGQEVVRPPILHLSAEKLNRYGVYLMDYGLVSWQIAGVRS